MKWNNGKDVGKRLNLLPLYSAPEIWGSYRVTFFGWEYRRWLLTVKYIWARTKSLETMRSNKKVLCFYRWSIGRHGLLVHYKSGKKWKWFKNQWFEWIVNFLYGNNLWKINFNSKIFSEMNRLTIYA